MARKAKSKAVPKPNPAVPFVPNQSLDAAAQVVRDSAIRQRQHVIPATSQPEGSPAVLLASALKYTVPAWATPEGKERIKAYYEALGRFIDMFSQVETAVTLVLRAYAGTPVHIAKIVFQNATAETSTATIKQLAETTNAAQGLKDDLEYVFQQFAGIKNARNAIMHYGADKVAEGKAVVSNALKAKGTPFVFPISPTLLDDMTADLRKMTYHLNYNHLGRSMPKGALNALALMTSLQAPWRYKHPEQPSEPTKGKRSLRSRKRAQERARQRRP